MKPVIMVHGGAANIEQERICGKLCGIQDALRVGYDILINGGNAVDAVESAINIMENNEYFNAGYGAVLNLDGEVEMDASIMDGSDLSAGSCAIVRNVSNPISLAKLIRANSPHVMLAADGASEFARDNGMVLVAPETLVTDYSRKVLEHFRNDGNTVTTREMGGTVGCVALDLNGNLAAGTSTGGTNGKLRGRVGDTPQIGSGTYADDNWGAVSCTGHGEAILKCCSAFAIVKDMELGMNAMSATKKNMTNLTARTGSTAGAIAISKNGDVGFYFTTKMMPWAYVKDDVMHVGMEQGQDFCGSNLACNKPSD